jgi:SAM-dependent methyltransferase
MLTPLWRIVAVPSFWIWRATLSCRSILNGNIRRMMGRRAYPYIPAAVVLLPLYVAVRLMQRAARSIQACFTDYALVQYFDFIRRHYGSQGDGYHWVKDVEAERARPTPPSRLLPFHQRFPGLTRFEDGDSFLELGCGTGNELSHLAQAFPASRIEGIDFNPRAVQVIDGRFDGRVRARSADLADLSVLRDIPSGSIDHVLFVHSDSYMFGRGIEATVQYRRQLMAEAARVAAKGVVFIREIITPKRPPRFEMARDIAGMVRDDLTALLLSLGAGEVVAMFGSPDTMVVLRKPEPGVPDAGAGRGDLTD